MVVRWGLKSLFLVGVACSTKELEGVAYEVRFQWNQQTQPYRDPGEKIIQWIGNNSEVDMIDRQKMS